MAGPFPVGSGGYPSGIAFDGTDMWVTSQSPDFITKVLPDGGVGGMFAPTVTLDDGGTGPVCAGPNGLAFDGTNMWIACTASGNVIELRPDGGLAGTFYLDGGSRVRSRLTAGTYGPTLQRGLAAPAPPASSPSCSAPR